MKESKTSNRLKQIMAERALKQIDILRMTLPYCDQFGVKMNKSDISQYCSGKVEPNQNKLFALSAALNVNEAWLMGYDVPRERMDPKLLSKQNKSNKQLTQKQNIFSLETKMLESFSQLNNNNKKKSISYTENLLSNQKLEEELLPNAAHADTTSTLEELQAGNNIMTDDSEWE